MSDKSGYRPYAHEKAGIPSFLGDSRALELEVTPYERISHLWWGRHSHVNRGSVRVENLKGKMNARKH